MVISGRSLGRSGGGGEWEALDRIHFYRHLFFTSLSSASSTQPTLLTD